VARRKKNDVSGLGILVIIFVGLIVILVQKLGWWLIPIIGIPLVIYLIYRFNSAASSGEQETTNNPKRNESFSTWASSQQISIRSDQTTSKKDRTFAKWISKGNSVEVNGYSISNGLFYLGDYLPSVNSSSTDPALVVPKLSVNKSSLDSIGSTMGYWPSYSNITPEARAAYLNWLSGDRNDPSTNIGYVFLYFYGLERRALYDSREDSDALAENSVIIEEVKRLLNIYGKSSGSFHGYASSFHSYLSSHFHEDLSEPSNFAAGSYGELPFSLKRTLGRLSVEGKPIPAALAFSWFELSPMISLRTPARRCHNEFVKLFYYRYEAEFGQGMVIPPNKTMLRCEYHPASSSFSGQTCSNELENIPDITKLSRPVSAFQKIADACMEDLEGYSRFLGKKQEAQENKIFALAQLPAAILNDADYPEIQQISLFLKKSTSNGLPQTIDFSSLLSTLGLPADQPLSSSESLLVAQLLGHLGYGLEPDIRFGGAKIEPTQKAVVFSLDESKASAASPAYVFASLLLSFSALIIHADGTVCAAEEEKLRSHVSSILALTESEKQRLNALLAYLFTTPPSFSSVKKRVDTLTNEAKSFILTFLISVANADGNIDPSEIKILKKIYELFGKESSQIYSDVHAFQTAGDAPVLVSTAQASASGFSIPKKKLPSSKREGISLNMALVEKTLQQTNQVQSILSNIFTEKDDTAPIVQPSISKSENIIANLDASHSDLFKKLSSLDSISIDDFHNICKELSILPGGAIESINNACFDKVNDLYIEEDEDTLVLNKNIAKEMFV
jgi:uncharacterized tellurite resistance protein B-like protein